MSEFKPHHDKNNWLVFVSNRPDTLHIYQDFRAPIDIRSVRTMHDLELSSALASTLVAIDAQGNPQPFVASHWKVEDRTITLNLNTRSRWSDGSVITADQVVESFTNAKLHYANPISGLFDNYTSLRAPKQDQIIFTVRPGVSPQFFLKKLAEPMFGIVQIKDARPRTDVSSGPYRIDRIEDKNLHLIVNQHWFDYDPQSINKVHLRCPTQPITLATFQADSWPDIISTARMTLKSELENVNSKCARWERRWDRLLLLSIKGDRLEATRLFFSYLRTNCSFKIAVDLISSARLATQIYPECSAHYREQNLNSQIVEPADLQSAWPQGKIVLAYDPNRLPYLFVQELQTAINSQIPIQCEFKDIHLGGHVDVHLTSVGVDSINVDGAIGFYLELENPVIRSDDSSTGNFIERLRLLRRSLSQEDSYDKILFDVIAGNYILPILHYSTLWLGRNNIDFSRASRAAETIPYQNIRRLTPSESD